MSRDSGITFDLIRRACFEILSRGERPSRPSVQDLLVTDRYLGQKGSNALVQKHINDFWGYMGQTLQLSPRSVDGVPEAFVPILDKALAEMVTVARQLAGQEFADKLAAFETRKGERAAAIQEARDNAALANQLRVRAEGELSALLSVVTDMKASLQDAEARMADEVRKNAAHQATIDEKDAEIRRQFAVLETANRALEQASEQHRAENHRLMQQLDDSRQAALKESLRLTAQVDRLQAETTGVRADLAAQREENVRLRAERVADEAVRSGLESALKELKEQVAAREAELQNGKREIAVLRVRFETAEDQRRDAVARNQEQAADLGRLGETMRHLQAEIQVLRAAALS